MKSREDLIMSEEAGPSAGVAGPGGAIDPFGAAPFNPNHKAQGKRVLNCLRVHVQITLYVYMYFFSFRLSFHL